jgi:arylsulfatase A-like enzyme
VVTADHGEAFYEHGFWEHARSWRDEDHHLYQQILHVPLMVKWPNATHGKRVGAVVSQVDIFPTLLEAAGVGAQNPLAVSLGRHRDGGGMVDEARLVLSEFLSIPTPGGVRLEIAVRRRNLKYVASFRADGSEDVYRSEAHGEALYDLEHDPGENRSLPPGEVRGVEELRAFLRDYLAAGHHAQQDPEGAEVTLDPEVLRKLEALGYLEH